MNIKTDVKQQKRLDKFFAEENTWFPDNVGEKFLAIFFLIISGILLCIPNRIDTYRLHVLFCWSFIYGHEIQIIS